MRVDARSDLVDSSCALVDSPWWSSARVRRRCQQTQRCAWSHVTSGESSPELPSVLRRLSSDEYDAPPYEDEQRHAVSDVATEGPEVARRLHRPLADYWSSRMGTAAGLLSLNDAFGVRCYDVPADARHDQAAADDAFAGDEVVIDVQTHYTADREAMRKLAPLQIGIYRDWAPDWWFGLEGVTFYSFAEYLRCVFVESETAVAVLTAPPADREGEDFLTNEEMVGTRELLDRFAGTGRLLTHTVVHPTDPGTLENMETWRDELHPVGWKVYTMGHRGVPERGERWDYASAFMLDDERTGIPFLQRARELGVVNICTHKGLSGLVDNGSPRDVGPAAKAFPDLRFIVYHSGYEVGEYEGPYTAETAHEGINRLITSVRSSGITPGGNVYAELGSTWFCLVKRPLQAAHVLGKLLLAFGEDNILWGTDAIWYGPSQPVLDAFRAFQIPTELSERFGYPKLTPEIKAKILGTNASRVYGIDLDAARRASRADDLAWTKAAVAAYREP
jgi:predicted TIM-barrel fold metal-dependent hydrolase